MEPGAQTASFVRDVGGEVVSSVAFGAPSARVEIISRRCPESRMAWHYCQPELALFWYRRGIRRLNGRADGMPLSCVMTRQANLAIIPPSLEIHGDWTSETVNDYAVVFFDHRRLQELLPSDFRDLVMMFESRALTLGMQQLCEEALAGDGLFELFAEGWVLQALAHMARASRTSPGRGVAAIGGLSPRRLSGLHDYLLAHLVEPLTIADMAAQVGLSPRHFIRAFRQSVGVTPHRHVLELRVGLARRLLSTTVEPVTSIALNCGFGNTQHFSNTFRRLVGCTPSQYRRQGV